MKHLIAESMVDKHMLELSGKHDYKRHLYNLLVQELAAEMFKEECITFSKEEDTNPYHPQIKFKAKAYILDNREMGKLYDIIQNLKSIAPSLPGLKELDEILLH